MRVFISGVMQGSRQDRDVQRQSYRQLIAQALRQRHPGVEVIDPWELYPGAVDFSPEQAKQTLLDEIAMARTCDVIVAYVPEASMGSALEMWAAYEEGARVYTISPMEHNWVLQSISSEIFSALEDFLSFVESDGLTKHLDGSKSDR